MAQAAAWVIYRSGSNVYVQPFSTVADAHDFARRNRGVYKGMHVVTSKADYNKQYLHEKRMAGNITRREERRLSR